MQDRLTKRDENGVPFFLKQMEIDGKIVKMPELDGQMWRQMPERVTL